MAETPRTRVRQRIKRLLEEHGKTQREFAKWLGHGDQWASNLLRGEFSLSLDELDRVAAFFTVPPSEIVRASDDPWELSPTEMRVIRAIRLLPPPVRESYAMLADWTVGALPEEYDLLIAIRSLNDAEVIAALKHWIELKRVEIAHAQRARDRVEPPGPAPKPTPPTRRTRGDIRT